jgi:hypothetical protein
MVCKGLAKTRDVKLVLPCYYYDFINTYMYLNVYF